MELRVEYASRTELVAIGSHVVVRIVDGHRTQTEDFDRLEAAIATKLAAAPLFGVLQVVCHGTPTPPPAVRRHGAQLMERYPSNTCVVVALVGLGFWSSALATALMGFASLLRLSSIHVETSVDAAADLLARELVGLNAEALGEAYADLYAHMRSL